MNSLDQSLLKRLNLTQKFEALLESYGFEVRTTVIDANNMMTEECKRPEGGVFVYINDYSKHKHDPKYKLVLNTPDHDGDVMKKLQGVLGDLGLGNKPNSWARIDIDWKTPEEAHAQVDALLMARQKELDKGSWVRSFTGHSGTEAGSPRM